MSVKLANNGAGNLASNLGTGDTAIYLQAGQGARFPALTAGEWFPATLVKSDGTFEIVKVTARAGDTLTATRAQEGTAALAFGAGDRIELRATAAVFSDLQAATATAQATADAALPKAGGTLTGALNEAKGADLASAATVDLGAAPGNYVQITGTTTITAFGTAQAGTRRLVRFTEVLTLTHNATSLILPTGYNVATEAGDLAEFVSEGAGNWRCTRYLRGSGQPLLAPQPNGLINGNFDIWQRGTSQTLNGYGSDDRWSNEHSGTTKTHSRQAFTLGQTAVPGNPKYFSRTATTSVAGAGNFAYKLQKIEGVASYAGETVTLSFYAKADTNKNIALEFYQYFGFGGSPSAGVSTPAGLIALTSSWQEFHVTLAVPSVSGKTLGTDGSDWVGPLFWFDAGLNFNARASSLGQQSGTFDIANVRIRKAGADTLKRPLQNELALCQRYFEKSYPDGVVAGTATLTGARRGWTIGNADFADAGNTQYQVAKRATPALTFYSTNGAAGNLWDETAGANFAITPDVGRNSTQGFGLASAGGGLTVSRFYRWQWTADAEL